VKEAAYKFFTVREVPLVPGLYEVRAKRGNALLATIEYYDVWKQWVAQAVENTVWSEGCLTDLADALRRLREEE